MPEVSLLVELEPGYVDVPVLTGSVAGPPLALDELWACAPIAMLAAHATIVPSNFCLINLPFLLLKNGDTTRCASTNLIQNPKLPRCPLNGDNTVGTYNENE